MDLQIGLKIYMDNIEVIYLTPNSQWCKTIKATKDLTVEGALINSGFVKEHSNLDLGRIKVGIFSKRVDLYTPVKVGDRIEVYRSLTIDPKARRKLLSKKN